MKKVCVFCEKWASGGIESFWNNVLHHMNLEDLSVDIVVAELKESVFTKPLQDLGIHFFELSGNLHHLSRNHKLFKTLLKEQQYDVVHINAYQGMTLYYAEIAKRAGVQVRIAHSHNTALRKSPLRPLKLLIHKIYCQHYIGSATNLWACSQQAAIFMFTPKQIAERNYTFIPNGIDIGRFKFCQEERDKKRQELGLEGKFVIGNVGRLCYQKNQAFLLNLMVELLKLRSDSYLLLVGDGEDFVALQEKARQMEIEDHVLFYGTTNKVEELFWAMDVFAFPSRFEGLGIVAIEAQAAGLPVLCSDNVPREAFITNNAQAIPLDAEKWLSTLIDVKIEGRTSTLENTPIDSFNITNVAKEIECVFRFSNGKGH